MEPPKFPPDEAQRLLVLEGLAVLDTPPEQQFDDIVRIAAQICRAPIALISLVDSQRQWFKARYGIDAAETGRDVSFCGHAINQRELFEVPDSSKDARFADNPLVVGPPHVRFYAGYPLVTGSDQAIGTLCVIDHEPRELSDEQREALGALACQAIRNFESRRIIPLVHKFESFLDHSPAAIVFKDGGGRFTHVNRTFCSWMARPAAEILGKTSAQLHSEDDAIAFGELDREIAATGKLVRGENTIAFPDGKTRRISSIKFPLFSAEGKVEEVASIHSDITKQHEAEAALQRAQRMDVLGQLTGGISHDFNNLLTVVQGNLELVRSSPLSEDADARLAKALDALDRGRSLVRHLLSFARRQALKPEATSVADVVRQVLNLFERTVRGNIALDVAIDGGLPLAFVDAGQLESAVLNLLLNSQDAMPDGGTLRIRAEEDDDPKFVRLTVEDQGTGIPDTIIANVLEPFFTTKEPGKGSGLGLSMVYGFARQSGGDVRISSKEGKGTTVALLLPVAGEAVSEATVPTTQEQPKRGTGRVLLVEDNPELREMASDMLLALGYEVAATDSGGSALALLETSTPFDVVLTDIMLPGGMHGTELAKQISEKYPAIRIILTSGYDPNALKRDGLEAFQFMPKPFRMKDLSRALTQAIER